MKRVYIVFEIPELILNDLAINGDAFTPEGVILHPIKIDTDLKHTLLNLCIRESVKQEIQDGKTFAKAGKNPS